jgi:hypothetical protein
VDSDELSERKRRLSPKLLQLRGVSGVGLREGSVAIYLESDEDDVRQQAQALVDANAPGTPIAFEVTGAFRKS